MRKDEVLAMFQGEKKAEKTPSKAWFYGGIQSNVLAQVVNHCFDTDMVATFKDLDMASSLVKSGFDYDVISSYKNVVIYNSIGDLTIQYTKNDKQDSSVINTTLIKIRKNGKVEGESRTYTLVKENYSGTNIDESFAEEVISKCQIDDVNDISLDKLTGA